MAKDKIEKKVENAEEHDPDVKPNKMVWVKDTKGRQGEVLFDGKLYWLTRIDQDSGRAFNVPMTQKEWDERNAEMTLRAKTK
jgi:hypothetical protein